ncbi:MAG: response regulator [Magnetococcus sp. YQC-5]
MAVPCAASVSRQGRLLVVDDDDLSRQLAAIMLRDWVLDVVSVGTGQEGLDRFIAESFDLILLDIQMPGMNGYETCQKMREFERTHVRRPTPVIALTGTGISQEMERYLASGMNDFLVKPLRMKSLYGLLSRWLTVSPVMPVAKSSSTFSKVLSEEEVPLVDVQALEILRNELSRVPGAFENILTLFLSDIPDKLRELQSALDGGHPENVIRLAHNMKSQCGAVGALALKDIFFKMESLAQKGHLADVAERMEYATALFAQVSFCLQQAAKGLWPNH